ncbi:MAG: DUF5674 family protein [Pyrinomonadaceae bacterium]
MDVVLVDKPMSRQQLKNVAKDIYGDMVKAVVDVEKGIMAISGELHADEEAFLIQRDSRQEDLWGINLYPDRDVSEMVEFDSMINIRPRQNNRSRSVEDAKIRERILAVVGTLVQ